jgi:hypothetical protein
MRTLLLVLALGACGPKHSNQCPDNNTGHCLNGDVCSLDRNRGCQVCQCRPIDQIPTGRDPDDQSSQPR